MLQPDNSIFSVNGFEDTEILGNIVWNMRQPLDTAVLVDRTTDAEYPMSDELKVALNDIYLMPPTRSVTITMWDRRPGKRGQITLQDLKGTMRGRTVEEILANPGYVGNVGTPPIDWNKEFVKKDVLLTVPDSWPYGMNLWQLLGGIASYIEYGKQQHGEAFVGRDMFGGLYIDKTPNHLTLHTWA